MEPLPPQIPFEELQRVPDAFVEATDAALAAFGLEPWQLVLRVGQLTSHGVCCLYEVRTSPAVQLDKEDGWLVVRQRAPASAIQGLLTEREAVAAEALKLLKRGYGIERVKELEAGHGHADDGADLRGGATAGCDAGAQDMAGHRHLDPLDGCTSGL
jgi:hypothetical protein